MTQNGVLLLLLGFFLTCVVNVNSITCFLVIKVNTVEKNEVPHKVSHNTPVLLAGIRLYCPLLLSSG